MDTAFLPGKVRLPLNSSQAGRLSHQMKDVKRASREADAGPFYCVSCSPTRPLERVPLDLGDR